MDGIVVKLVATNFIKNLMKIFTFCLFIIILNNVQSQLFHYQKFTKKRNENSILKLSEDSLHSTFLITIPKNVVLHYHAYHTESIIVLEGKALMKLGSDTLTIMKGNQITILKGTPHEVIKVISKKPLVVYSIQSPLFDGTDRILINP